MRKGKSCVRCGGSSSEQTYCSDCRKRLGIITREEAKKGYHGAINSNIFDASEYMGGW